MDAGLVNPSRLALNSIVLVGHLRSLTYMNFDGAGSSRVKFFEEDGGSDPEGGDAWVEIHLDDEPGSLLDSLNAGRRRLPRARSRGFLGFLTL